MTNSDNIKNKITNLSKIDFILSYHKFKNHKIVFTNGCFDIIHRGHIEYLSKAADMGDVLIVGLNTDNSVKRIKGKSRPLQDEYTRALILSALQFVSNVILFDEDTPVELIKKIKPDILVKGADYKIQDIAGADIVKAYGGKVETIEITEGFSTSNIIDKLKL